MNNNLVDIQVLGTSFKIQVNEDPEYIERILKHLKTVINKVELTTSIKDPLKTAILLSVFVIDELYKEKENSNDPSEEKEVSELTEKMISCIDNILEN
jgi:cell division protein ZapA (FtsZ GTPase activity inhibitor)